MEPHMIENELVTLVFMIWINHVGFMTCKINAAYQRYEEMKNSAKELKCLNCLTGYAKDGTGTGTGT